jgi:hypothetical protein
MKFRSGDRVRFLNDSGGGIVEGYDAAGFVLVKDEDGFTYQHQESELVVTDGSSSDFFRYQQTTPDLLEVIQRNVDRNAAQKATAQFKKAYSERGEGPLTKDLMEVDLHIHELTERTGNLMPGEMVQLQLEHFERMLRIAEERKIPKVIFIHGVGQGVLRGEIRKMLTMYYPHCEFMDAPYHTYGFGATEVRIRKM